MPKSIDTPLAELTLRRYEAPHHLSKRDLIAKLCLSVGLLQPGDSRDIVIDVLYTLMDAAKDRTELSSIDVRNRVVKLREELNMPIQGTADSNIRRQLKRLRDIMLVEKIKNNYRISEFARTEVIFSEKIERILMPTLLGRVKEYCSAIDKDFFGVEKD